jgi:hypothetical protein
MTIKKWKIQQGDENLKYPAEILQEFANALAKETDRVLVGQVTESISYDSQDRPKLYYALHVYITKLKQSYRLLEVEQISETPYPVNLKVILYTGSQDFLSLKNAKTLENKIGEITQNKLVGNLLSHFINLSNLKNDRKN